MQRFLFLVTLLFVSAANAENWPAWRGPHGTGVSTEKGIPTAWGAEKNIAWKVPMPGRGGATPAICNDRIFLTSGQADDQVLLCIDTRGKQLWKRVVGSGGRAAIKGDEANEASASPSTDGKHVFAFVGTGHLACFDFAGKQIWNVDIQKRYGGFKIQHGLHSTPLLHEDRLYLNLLHGRLHASRYRASPTYADGKVTIAARDGTFSVVKAGPKFELLATNELPDAFTASPAISNGTMYLRGFEHLYAVRDSAR